MGVGWCHHAEMDAVDHEDGALPSSVRLAGTYNLGRDAGDADVACGHRSDRRRGARVHDRPGVHRDGLADKGLVQQLEVVPRRSVEPNQLQCTWGVILKGIRRDRLDK